MKATFRGFLTKYCKELTSSNTVSLKKLFQLADSEYPRAYEPLLLLAICEERETYLLKQAQKSAILSRYESFLSKWKANGKSLETYLATLEEGNRFRRPLDAWLAEQDRVKDDRKMLVQVAHALSRLLDAKHITRAAACRLTHVNKGNFYAFLKGDTSKLSRKTAMRIYRQIEAL